MYETSGLCHIGIHLKTLPKLDHIANIVIGVYSIKLFFSFLYCFILNRLAIGSRRVKVRAEKRGEFNYPMDLEPGIGQG